MLPREPQCKSPNKKAACCKGKLTPYSWPDPPGALGFAKDCDWCKRVFLQVLAGALFELGTDALTRLHVDPNWKCHNTAQFYIYCCGDIVDEVRLLCCFSSQ